MDARISGIFGLAVTQAPLSAFTQVMRREVGMTGSFFDPSVYLEKGKEQLEEGNIENASRFFCIAKNCCKSNSNQHAKVLIKIAEIEYAHQLYKDAIQTLERLPLIHPSYEGLADLKLSFCLFHLNERKKCNDLLSVFSFTWIKWIFLDPSTSPLSADQFAIYKAEIDRAIEMLAALNKQRLPTKQQRVFLKVLFYFYFAQNRLDETEEVLLQLEEIDYPLSSQFRCFNILTSKESTEKDELFSQLGQLQLEWTKGSGLNNFLLLNLLLSEGLHTLNPRPLGIALTQFLAVEASLTGTELLLLMKRRIFTCYLALGQPSQAQEIALAMETLRPGSAALQLSLCRLAQAETLAQDSVDDFKACLKSRDVVNADPTFLQFVGDFIQSKSMDRQSSSPTPCSMNLVSIALEFYQWASSFHGQPSPEVFRSDFIQRELAFYRNLYSQKQFELALCKIRNLFWLSPHNSFLLEIALCLFQLERR